MKRTRLLLFAVALGVVFLSFANVSKAANISLIGTWEGISQCCTSDDTDTSQTLTFIVLHQTSNGLFSGNQTSGDFTGYITESRVVINLYDNDVTSAFADATVKKNTLRGSLRTTDGTTCIFTLTKQQ